MMSTVSELFHSLLYIGPKSREVYCIERHSWLAQNFTLGKKVTTTVAIVLDSSIHLQIACSHGKDGRHSNSSQLYFQELNPGRFLSQKGSPRNRFCFQTEKTKEHWNTLFKIQKFCFTQFGYYSDFQTCFYFWLFSTESI